MDTQADSQPAKFSPAKGSQCWIEQNQHKNAELYNKCTNLRPGFQCCSKSLSNKFDSRINKLQQQ